MRTIMMALTAAGIGLCLCGGANAVPADATAAKAAADLSAAQPAQYSERRTRHGIVKCYRELIFGRYVCHTYHYW